jgi:hypothetical protein
VSECCKLSINEEKLLCYAIKKLLGSGIFLSCHEKIRNKIAEKKIKTLLKELYYQSITLAEKKLKKNTFQMQSFL